MLTLLKLRSNLCQIMYHLKKTTTVYFIYFSYISFCVVDTVPVFSKLKVFISLTYFLIDILILKVIRLTLEQFLYWRRTGKAVINKMNAGKWRIHWRILVIVKNKMQIYVIETDMQKRSYKIITFHPILINKVRRHAWNVYERSQLQNSLFLAINECSWRV